LLIGAWNFLKKQTQWESHRIADSQWLKTALIVNGLNSQKSKSKKIINLLILEIK